MNFPTTSRHFVRARVVAFRTGNAFLLPREGGMRGELAIRLPCFARFRVTECSADTPQARLRPNIAAELAFTDSVDVQRQHARQALDHRRCSVRRILVNIDDRALSQLTACSACSTSEGGSRSGRAVSRSAAAMS